MSFSTYFEALYMATGIAGVLDTGIYYHSMLSRTKKLIVVATAPLVKIRSNYRIYRGARHIQSVHDNAEGRKFLRFRKIVGIVSVVQINKLCFELYCIFALFK